MARQQLHIRPDIRQAKHEPHDIVLGIPSVLAFATAKTGRCVCVMEPAHTDGPDPLEGLTTRGAEIVQRLAPDFPDLDRREVEGCVKEALHRALRDGRRTEGCHRFASVDALVDYVCGRARERCRCQRMRQWLSTLPTRRGALAARLAQEVPGTDACDADEYVRDAIERVLTRTRWHSSRRAKYLQWLDDSLLSDERKLEQYVFAGAKTRAELARLGESKSKLCKRLAAELKTEYRLALVEECVDEAMARADAGAVHSHAKRLFEKAGDWVAYAEGQEAALRRAVAGKFFPTDHQLVRDSVRTALDRLNARVHSHPAWLDHMFVDAKGLVSYALKAACRGYADAARARARVDPLPHDETVAIGPTAYTDDMLHAVIARDELVVEVGHLNAQLLVWRLEGISFEQMAGRLAARGASGTPCELAVRVLRLYRRYPGLAAELGADPELEAYVDAWIKNEGLLDAWFSERVRRRPPPQLSKAAYIELIARALVDEHYAATLVTRPRFADQPQATLRKCWERLRSANDWLAVLASETPPWESLAAGIGQLDAQILEARYLGLSDREIAARLERWSRAV
jgi:hypothetical protein